MKKHGLILTAALLTLASCSERQAPEAGEGSVNFRPEVTLRIEDRTRAEQIELPAGYAPDVDDFSLKVESDGLVEIEDQMQAYLEEYTLLSDYDNDNPPMMPTGTYTATVSYGDPTAEGPAAYCYGGTVGFTIVARKTIETTITATLSNSAVSLQLGDWFNDYYKDAEFTVRTDSGNEFEFDATTTGLVFIKPDTKIYLSGKATKIRNGVEVEFEEKEIGTSVASSWHRINIELQEVGEGSFVIDLIDDLGEPVVIEDIELNPEV